MRLLKRLISRRPSAPLPGQRRILSNRARCEVCSDMLESRHYDEEAVCTCGNLAVSGGRHALRRRFDSLLWTDHSEVEQ